MLAGFSYLLYEIVFAATEVYSFVELVEITKLSGAVIFNLSLIVCYYSSDEETYRI